LSSTSNGNSIGYGPYNFGATGTPTDSVTLGPDTILNRLTDASTPSSVVPYIGTGTVDFSLVFGGGTIATGGLNFNYTVRTKYWGWFLLTYYWCPNSVLATSIQDFTAIPNGNSILLKWQTNNEQNNIQYEIQASTNGQSFATIGETVSNPASAGVTAKYQYQYNPDQATVGTIYLRIKETDATGKISYSVILIVNPGGSTGQGPVSYQTYPNPATNNLTLQFNTNLTGRYLLELVNTAGQVVLNKSVTMSGTSQISLDLSPQPAKGLYFLRTTDQTHGKSYVSKVFVQ
jgi:type IX secretion system substrate protein